MFVDSVKVFIKAGNGGNGIVSFLREKYIVKGGPDGGRGGNGGSIIFIGEPGLTTLLDFHYRRKIVAPNGQDGMKKNMYGAKGEDIIVKVPLGTVVTNLDNGKVIADVTKPDHEYVIARGGRGGRGNSFFANSRHTTPDFCEKGEPGVEFNAGLELKVLADVGLVGFPSVGKSTLISVISAAKPKIADYHFTTLNPNLGVVGVPDGRSFIVADLPGLIEGAHLGLGLGIQFLKHIERTRIIVHVIDMSSLEGRDPVDDYNKINHELASYNMDLLKRPQIIVANKMDIPGAEENLKKFKEATGIENVIPLSAATKQNLNELIYSVADKLDEVRQIPDPVIETEVVEYKFKQPEAPFTIELGEDGIFNVVGPMIKKLFEKTDFNNDPSIRRFAKQIRDLGVDDALREKGVQNGDTVRILDYEFEFYD